MGFKLDLPIVLDWGVVSIGVTPVFSKRLAARRFKQRSHPSPTLLVLIYTSYVGGVTPLLRRYISP